MINNHNLICIGISADGDYSLLSGSFSTFIEIDHVTGHGANVHKFHLVKSVRLHFQIIVKQK